MYYITETKFNVDIKIIGNFYFDDFKIKFISNPDNIEFKEIIFYNTKITAVITELDMNTYINLKNVKIVVINKDGKESNDIDIDWSTMEKKCLTTNTPPGQN